MLSFGKILCCGLKWVIREIDWLRDLIWIFEGGVGKGNIWLCWLVYAMVFVFFCLVLALDRRQYALSEYLTWFRSVRLSDFFHLE